MGAMGGSTTEPNPKVSSNVTITPISSTVMATASATQPPPSIVEAKSRATATILSSNTSTPQSSTRVVRVLQSSKGTMPTSISSLKSATTVVVTPASSSSSSSTSGSRSRKQVFVTAKKSVVPHISVNPPEIGSAGTSSAAAEDERDIL